MRRLKSIFSSVFYLFLFSFLGSSSIALGRDYKNFQLPKRPIKPLPPQPLSFEDTRVKLSGKIQQKSPSVDHQEFLFAKESFLSEKRDEAIKLLRQQIESGYKHNLDNMLLRLGQLYTEKYMEFSYLETETFNKEYKEFEEKKRTKAPKIDNTRSLRSLNLALNVFAKLHKNYPNHPRSDEILFFIGFVNMELGRVTTGTKYLTQMLQKYPKSKKVDEALLYMGDYNFDRRLFKKALQRYVPVLKNPKSQFYNYALYKAAWCRLNIGEKEEGLRNMKHLVAQLEKEEDPAKFNLRNQALSDLVVFYVELEKVDEAVEYFTDKMGKEKAIENLRLMAASFLAQAKDKAAIRAYKMLLTEFGQSKEAPTLQLALYEAYGRLGDHKRANAILMKAIEDYGPQSAWAKKFSKDELQATHETLKEEGKKAAFFYHHTAQKSKNKEYYNYALALYATLVAQFPSLPERRQFMFNQAEIYYNQGRFLEAADLYLAVAKADPQDKLSEEAAYSALISVDELTFKSKNIKRYSVTDQKNLKFTPEPILEKEQRFLDVAKYYLDRYPKSEKVTDIKFRMATVYYQHQHLDEALVLFKEIALNQPKHQSATTAANVSLDIYNIKKDYASLSELAVVFAKTKGLGDEKFRADLKRINSEIAFKNIESLEKESKWAEAGSAYYNFYKSSPGGSLGEQALYNSVVSYEKTQDEAKTAEVSRLFLAKYPQHDYSKRLMLKLATTAESQFNFSEAKDRYLAYVRKYPKDSEAPKALYNAAIYSEILEENRTALKLYEEYLGQRNINKEIRRAVMESQVKLYLRQKSYTKSIEGLEALLKMAESPAERVQLVGQMADIYKRVGNRMQYKETQTRIRNFAGKSSADSLGAASKYVAQIKFSQIEELRREYDRIKLRLPPATLVKALKEKQSRLVKLDSSYSDVVNFGNAEWGVAALYEKGEIYDQFVKGYRAIEVSGKYSPAEQEELKKQLQEIEEEIIKPLAEKSQQFTKICVEKASELNVISDYATKCFDKMGDPKNVPEGLVPGATFWTTRWISRK